MTCLIPLLLALSISLMVTPWLRSMAIRRKLVNHPDGERWSSRSVPLLGGTAIFFAFAVPSLSLSGGGVQFHFLAGGFCMFLLGLLDDILSLPTTLRLAVEMLTAYATVRMGMGTQLTPLPWLDCVISMVWIVGITNSLNLLDNMDGAAAGIAMVASAGFLTLSIWQNALESTFASAAIIGACLGFLRFNFRPASIYMGDSGSLFLGYLLAVLAIASTRHSGTIRTESFIPALLVMGLACFDTTLVSLLRLRNGRMPWHGGRDHVSHRLAALLGGSESLAVLTLYGIGVACAVLGLVAARSGPLPCFLILGGCLAGFIIFGLLLSRISCYGITQREEGTHCDSEPPTDSKP